MSTINTVSTGFAVLDGLYSGLVTAGYLPAVSVFDGDTVGASPAATYIIIGATGPEDPTAMRINQGWHSLGLQAERDDLGSVFCLITGIAGTVTDMVTARGNVRDALADLTAAAQNLSIATLVEAHLQDAVIEQAQASNGPQVLAKVQIDFQALLTSWP